MGLGTLQPADGYVTNFAPRMADLNNSAQVSIDRVLYKIRPQWGSTLRVFAELRRKEAFIGKDYKIYYEVQKQMPRFDVVSAAVAATGTVYVTHGEYFGRGELVKNERTGEIFRNNEKYTSGSPDSLATVTRGWGTTAAAPMITGDVLIRLGHFGSEFQTMADFNFVAREQVYNYWAENRVSVGASEWAMLMKLMVGGDVWKSEVADKSMQFKGDKIARVIHGERYASTTDHSDADWLSGTGKKSDAKQFAFDGFIATMRRDSPADCCKNISGDITKRTFLDDVLGPWIFRGGNQKLLAMGQKGMRFIAAIKDSKLELQPDDQKMDLQLYTWGYLGKTINIVYDSVCDIPDVGTAAHGEMMLGFDFSDEFSPALLQIQADHFEPIVLADGARGKAGEFIGIDSFQNPHPECQMFVEGITDYV